MKEVVIELVRRYGKPKLEEIQRAMKKFEV